MRMFNNWNINLYILNNLIINISKIWINIQDNKKNFYKNIDSKLIIMNMKNFIINIFN